MAATDLTPIAPSDHLSYRPSMSLATAIDRAAMLAQLRAFFAERGVLEISTPILSHHGNSDVFIQSVAAHFLAAGKPKRGYLHTSPEFAMKRVLASYQHPIYQICQVFRDNEQGKRHNLEFTMLEWYRPSFDLHMLAKELETLIAVVLGHCTHLSSLSFVRLRYSEVFIRHLGIHPLTASCETLRQTAQHHDINLDMGDDHQGWLDLLFSHLIEPALGFDAPTLITDYPPATASLAKIATDADGHQVAQRFELYIHGLEIANAYDEVLNGKELLERFHQDNLMRAKLGLPTMPIDTHLIHACDDLPPCSGIALGVDRLFMIRQDTCDISDVLSFTIERA